MYVTHVIHSLKVERSQEFLYICLQPASEEDLSHCPACDPISWFQSCIPESCSHLLRSPVQNFLVFALQLLVQCQPTWHTTPSSYGRFGIGFMYFALNGDSSRQRNGLTQDYWGGDKVGRRRSCTAPQAHQGCPSIWCRQGWSMPTTFINESAQEIWACCTEKLVLFFPSLEACSCG